MNTFAFNRIVMMRLLICSVFFYLFIIYNKVDAQCIDVYNPSLFDRTEVLEIPWKEIEPILPVKDTSLISLIDTKTGRSVAYQYETLGSARIQNLLILVDIPQQQTGKYCFVKAKPERQITKTFGRYVPERKDDFAWENDKIAFRVYGKALENAPDNGWGIDVWAKRVTYPIINKWYQKGVNYHKDNGEGLDYYKVGFTLGAGDIAPFQENKIWFQGNYQDWFVLDNGPIRTSFKLTYKKLQIGDRVISFSKTITIDAGSQLNKIEMDYMWNDTKPLNLVLGIAKREAFGSMMLDEKRGLMAYWEPEHGLNGVDGCLGIACLAGKPTTMFVEHGHILSAVNLDKPGKLIYYNGAAWSKAGAITSASKWITYLDQQLTKDKLMISLTGF